MSSGASNTAPSGSTLKPLDPLTPRTLAARLRDEFNLPDDQRLFVATSGGIDSVVLAHLVAALHRKPVPVLLHVNHGLHPDAGAWQAAVAALADTLNVEFDTTNIRVESTGHGVEAAARESRYRWLISRSRGLGVLLTAHHRGDQSETLLLRLLRGAGVRGLSAMRPQSSRDGQRIVRPLLVVSRDAIVKYAMQQGLRWVDDPANARLDADRNIIRHGVLESLRASWPHVDQAIARSAAHLQEADELLTALANEDLAQVIDPTGRTPLSEHAPLNSERIRRLSRARIKNVLRVWLGRHGLAQIPHTRLEHAASSLFSDLPHGCVNIPGGSLRRYRRYVYLVSDTWSARWPNSGTVLRLAQQGETIIDSLGGVFDVEWRTATVDQHALDPKQLIERELCVYPRRGGETIKPVGRRHRRTLKNVFQEAGVPPWERVCWPLLWQDGRLVSVPGITSSGDACVAVGNRGIVVSPRAH